MAEILDRLIRKFFLDRRVSKYAPDKRMKIAVCNLGGSRMVEIRDWVLVPDQINRKGTWHPSSGYLIPMERVVAVRKALQKIEEEHGLSDLTDAEELAIDDEEGSDG